MKSKKLTEGILIFYAVMLVWIILFKMDVSVENFGQMRSINLVPFSQSVIVNDKLDVSEIIQNVLAFVPLGILIYTIWQEKSWKLKLGSVALTSLVLEVASIHFWSRGKRYHRCDHQYVWWCGWSWCCIRAFQNISKELEGCDQ